MKLLFIIIVFTLITGCNICDNDNPDKRYTAKSVDVCSRLKYACEINESYFSDDCGCGCEVTREDI